MKFLVRLIQTNPLKGQLQRRYFCNKRPHDEDNESKNVTSNLTLRSKQFDTSKNQLDKEDLAGVNKTRIAEIMEYYSQYEKELSEGGYKDPDVEKFWLGKTDSIENEPISLKRGSQGVFDVEELVQLLKTQKVSDICCIQIPAELNYVPHLIVGSAFSLRHLSSIVEFISKIYKRKRAQWDPSGLRKTESHTDWAAIDLGNVVLHVMMPEIRQKYDIESLWTIGAQFDELTVEKNELDQVEQEFEQFRRQIDLQRKIAAEQAK